MLRTMITLTKCSGCLAVLLMAACAVEDSNARSHAGVGTAGAPATAPGPDGPDAADPLGSSRDAGLAEGESCGNGALDPGEECDDTLPKHRCPTSQSDCEAARDICWRWRVEGDGCHRRCVHAQGVCGDVLDPREPSGLLKACRNECPAEFDVNDPWQ